MMVSEFHTHRQSICALFLLFLLSVSANAESRSPGDPIQWRKIETRYTIIHYQTEDNLGDFNNSIAYGDPGWTFSSLFADNEAESLADKVKSKVDTLFERVLKILDMRKRIQKVTINLYMDRGQLDEAFERVYEKKNRIRAWYIYEYKTIYLNLKDLHEGMLAHEMAHHIIDHFLLVRPPPASAEILARYVDSHLHKQ